MKRLRASGFRNHECFAVSSVLIRTHPRACLLVFHCFQFIVPFRAPACVLLSTVYCTRPRACACFAAPTCGNSARPCECPWYVAAGSAGPCAQRTRTCFRSPSTKPRPSSYSHSLLSGNKQRHINQNYGFVLVRTQNDNS